MHGVIFASFRDFVLTRFGADTAKLILADRPVYLMSEAYEDEEFLALVRDVCDATGVETDELVHDFGAFAGETTFPRLYPAFFSIAGGTRSFLLTVETHIHELVRATIPNARPPELDVTPAGDGAVGIRYSSARQLCVLLVGLVEGTAGHYGEAVEVTETACMRKGAPACTFEVRIAPAA